MVASKPILAMIDGEANSIITKSNCGFASEAEDAKRFAKYSEVSTYVRRRKIHTWKEWKIMQLITSQKQRY